MCALQGEGRQGENQREGDVDTRSGGVHQEGFGDMQNATFVECVLTAALHTFNISEVEDVRWQLCKIYMENFWYRYWLFRFLILEIVGPRCLYSRWKQNINVASLLHSKRKNMSESDINTYQMTSLSWLLGWELISEGYLPLWWVNVGERKVKVWYVF